LQQNSVADFSMKMEGRIEPMATKKKAKKKKKH
jgi:hypothetical protein